MRRESGTMAQMRDVDAGCECRVHDGLPFRERDFLPVYINGIESDRIGVFAHVIPLFQMCCRIIAMREPARLF